MISEPPELEFGVEAHLQIQIKGPTIFIGKIYIAQSLEETTLGFAFAMTGSLVPVVSIFNLFDLVLEAEIGITDSVPPAPVVKKIIIGGGICIGKYDKCVFLVSGASEEELIAARVKNGKHTNFTLPSHAEPHKDMAAEMEFIGNEHMDLWDQYGHAVTNPAKTEPSEGRTTDPNFSDDEDALFSDGFSELPASDIEGHTLPDALQKAQAEVLKLQAQAAEKRHKIHEIRTESLLMQVIFASLPTLMLLSGWWKELPVAGLSQNKVERASREAEVF